MHSSATPRTRPWRWGSDTDSDTRVPVPRGLAPANFEESGPKGTGHPQTSRESGPKGTGTRKLRGSLARRDWLRKLRGIWPEGDWLPQTSNFCACPAGTGTALAVINRSWRERCACPSGDRHTSPRMSAPVRGQAPFPRPAGTACMPGCPFRSSAGSPVRRRSP